MSETKLTVKQKLQAEIRELKRKNKSQPSAKDVPTMDWQQVALNGGPPCFAVGADGDPLRFCGRAELWHGHDDHHKYISFEAYVFTTAK